MASGVAVAAVLTIYFIFAGAVTSPAAIAGFAVLAAISCAVSAYTAPGRSWRPRLLRFNRSALTGGGVTVLLGALAVVLAGWFYNTDWPLTDPFNIVPPMLAVAAVVTAGVTSASFWFFMLRPLPLDEAVTPETTLRADRWVSIVFIAAAGLAGIAICLPSLFGPAPFPAFLSLASRGFVQGIGLGVVTVVVWSPWPWFVAARLILCSRGALPLRLFPFLEDAHERGVLRRVGPCYQFRHASIQEYFTVPGIPSPERD